MRILLLTLFVFYSLLGVAQTSGNFKQLRLLNNTDSVSLGNTTGIVRYDPVTGKYRFFNAVTQQWFSYATQASVQSSIRFNSDVTFVLSSGKSFGKYVNGQTAPWNGLTVIEAIIDAATEYINPVFTSFSVSAQATTVEVGTTISGSRTFTWAITANSGVVPTIDIFDVTGSSTLLAGTPNDGSQSVTVATRQLNANAATQVWRGVGNNTSPPGTFNSSNFTVTARFIRFYGATSSSPGNSAAIRALPQNDFHTGAATFNLNTGTTLTKFAVALPPSVTISTVFDLDALNANITSEYVLTGTINVLDAGGTSRSYNVYEMNVGVPYSSNHRHAITTAN